jgi:hypothetical protein
MSERNTRARAVIITYAADILDEIINELTIYEMWNTLRTTLYSRTLSLKNYTMSLAAITRIKTRIALLKF